MLPFDDTRWFDLEGGYRVPYDPRPAINRLRAGDEAAWDELWNELHHQGDVGIASYAAVPHIVQVHRERDVADWQTYALIGTIESCRGKKGNPELPSWLEGGYSKAWKSVIDLACRDLPRVQDETTVRSIIGAVALAKSLSKLGNLILLYTGDELDEMVEGYQS